MSLRPVYPSPDWDSLERQCKKGGKVYFWMPCLERLGEGLEQQTEVWMCVHSQRIFMPPCWRTSGHFGTILGIVVIILWPNSNILWLTISNSMETLRTNVWLRGNLSVNATAVPVLQSGLNVTPVGPWVVPLWIFSEGFTRAEIT